ncbi:Very-long-chain (3R)-3-hydroxyacyl-CoA dehydratase PASTICCINO 2A [Glycine max]|nr:Very-long-chain (3R)-3-hydroxyacyl-CoA dehydratase PASTICCINO 2A [Glycine max]
MAGFFSLLRRLYLSLYNWTVLCQVLYFVLKTLNESGHQYVYNAAEKPLLYAQTAAVLEILHGLVGLVRSPVTATLPQISSRLFLVWGILWSFPEIIRYSFFGFKETFGFTPSWLLWLRYSSFLVLYPTGISSEVGLIYIALPFIKASEKYCIRMPNKLNSSFDYFYAAIVAMGIYVVLTCTRTCLHRGRKLSPNRRESNATSVVFIDFGSNIGYTHVMSWFGSTYRYQGNSCFSC